MEERYNPKEKLTMGEIYLPVQTRLLCHKGKGLELSDTPRRARLKFTCGKRQG